jgi:type II secretory pathway component PulF
MVRFEYRARADDGRAVDGAREAVSREQLLGQLRAQGLLVLRIDAPEEARAPAAWRRVRTWLQPPRRVDVELELRQLAFLLRSGLPLLAALRTCARQSARPSLADLWDQVAEGVRGGSSFSQELARQRAIPPLVTSLVQVSEHTGQLELALERAADSLERQRERRAAVLTALLYPSIVLVLATATVAYMLIALIPKLSAFLGSIGRGLPPSTQLLVDLSQYVQRHSTALFLGFAAVVLLGTALWHSRLRARWIDPWLLGVPLAGRLLRLSGTAALAHNLSLLLASGVRLTVALQVVAPLLPNARLARALHAARGRVLEGRDLADALGQERGAFGPLLLSTIAIGEASGTLDEVLLEVAGFHDTQLRRLVQRLGALIEPLIVVLVGGIVGFVYLSFFAAIYSVASNPR